MKIGVMADVHAEIHGLNKALSIFKQAGIGDDNIFICGDLVGYGNYPEECCTTIRSLGCHTVAGNHDLAVLGMTTTTEYSPRALDGIDFANDKLSSSNLNWLKSLPLILQFKKMLFTHSNFNAPADFQYFEGIHHNFDMIEDVGFCGHTHSPALYLEMSHKQVEKVEIFVDGIYELGDRRAIINIGSLADPRSKVDQSCVVIYDTELRIVKFIMFKACHC